MPNEEQDRVVRIGSRKRQFFRWATVHEDVEGEFIQHRVDKFLPIMAYPLKYVDWPAYGFFLYYEGKRWCIAEIRTGLALSQGFKKKQEVIDDGLAKLRYYKGFEEIIQTNLRSNRMGLSPLFCTEQAIRGAVEMAEGCVVESLNLYADKLREEMPDNEYNYPREPFEKLILVRSGWDDTPDPGFVHITLVFKRK